MKVSFDFDGTLARKSVQDYAKELIALGYDVHITTRRFERIEDYINEFCIAYHINDLKMQHNYLFEVADELRIPIKNIHFMNMKDKSLYLREYPDFIWHLDDDPEDIRDINENSQTIGISCIGSSWRHKCNKLITIHNE